MVRHLWPLAVAAMAIAAGCNGTDTTDDGGEIGEMGSYSAASDPVKDMVEIAYFAYNRKGDRNKVMAQGASSTYVLLYSRSWIQSEPFGGPFERVVKKAGIQPSWKEMPQKEYEALISFIYERGFFDDMPGSETADLQRFNRPGYSTKVISVTKGERLNRQRQVVYLEDVVGEDSLNPRWDRFNECEQAILNAFSSIVDVRPKVSKGEFESALDDYIRRGGGK